MEGAWQPADGAALVDGVDKIAVLRANALGDFMMTLPALEALRAAYVGAEIVLLGTPMHRELLGGRPSPVDRVEVVPVTRGVREVPGEVEDPIEVDAWVEGVRAERFDLALQLHGGGGWSNPLVRRLGARVTAGPCAEDAEPLDRWTPYAHFQHEVHRQLESVALVGAEPVTTEPRLAVTDQDCESVDGLAELGLRPDAGIPLVVVHPGARDSRRRWPADRFGAVADALAEAGAQVVVVGDVSERPVADEVADRMRHRSTVLAGRLSLRQLVGLLDRAVLLVANDSGPRHLAEAVGTATVSVYWCGNLATAMPLTRSRHRVHVSWRRDCPVCGAPGLTDVYPGRYGAGCDHRPSWVTDVPVDEVLADALRLLDLTRS